MESDILGLSEYAFNYYSNLYNNGFFEDINSVVELGSQSMMVRFNKDNLVTFLEAIGKDPEKTLKETRDKIGKRSLYSILNRPYYHHMPGKYLYEWLGVNEYESIDADGMYDAHVFDLNKDIEKAYNFKKQFDLVTNNGTTEHVFNQYTCFKNIHALTKVGGYMIHGVPYIYHPHHSLFTYQPTLFLELAADNEYEFGGMWLSVHGRADDVGHGHLVEYSEDIIRQFAKEENTPYFCLFCHMKKVKDRPFKMPYQGSLAKISKLKDYSYKDEFKLLNFSATKKPPVWRKIANKILNIKF